jgi:hypothetical protein
MRQDCHARIAAATVAAAITRTEETVDAAVTGEKLVKPRARGAEIVPMHDRPLLAKTCSHTPSLF